MPTITVDAYCQKQSVAPTFVKLDVEGAEAEVLEGMKSTLQPYGPQLLIEIHPAQLMYAGLEHQIESKIGKPVSRISYPYGSSCAWVRVMARWAGYREGYGTRSGGSSLLNLHRFSVRSM